MMPTFPYRISVGCIWTHLLLLIVTKIGFVNAFIFVTTEYHPPPCHRNGKGPIAVTTVHKTQHHKQQQLSINNGTIQSPKRRTIRYMSGGIKGGQTTPESVQKSDSTTRPTTSKVQPPTKATKKVVKSQAKRKATKTEKQNKFVSNDRLHWIDDSDELIIQSSYDNQNCNSDGANLTTTSNKDLEQTAAAATTTTNYVRFKVRGNPLPLRRHRTNKGFMYNPSASAQASFRQMVEQIVYGDARTSTTEDHFDQPEGHDQQLEDDNDNMSILEQQRPIPLFNEHQRLVVSVLFCMKRPKSHFRNSIPGTNRLKETAPNQLTPTRTDVDNLAKFVLDSLNELIYDDDRQIISLHVTKILDNDNHCSGSTEVCIQAITDNHKDDDTNDITIEKVIQNSFTICSTN